MGEGLEEVISGLASPYLQRIYTDEPEKNTAAGLAYEFLIGGLMGAIGGAVKVPANLRAEKGIVKAAEEYFEAREQYGPTAEETQKKLSANILRCVAKCSRSAVKKVPLGLF